MTIPVRCFVGRVHHRDYALRMALHPLDASALPEGWLHIVHLAGGACLVDGALAVGPSVVLAAASPVLTPRRGAEGAVLTFHPSVVNSALSLDRLDRNRVLAGTTEQDAWLVRAFVDPAIAGRPLPLDGSLDAAIRATFARVAEEGEAQRDGNWPCRTRSFLIELLFRLRLHAEQPVDPMSPEAAGPLERALPLIREKLSERFSVVDLARWCGTNRSTLNAAFRAATGQSVRAHIIHVRIEVAATLLRDTGLPVAEIMARVGYENASHFGRQFRALLGVGPRAYRDAESTMPGRRRVGSQAPTRATMASRSAASPSHSPGISLSKISV